MPDPLDALGPMVARRRRELDLSLREASRASGVPVATLARIEQGRMPDLATFRRVVEWLGVAAETFFTPSEKTENTPLAIAEHLRADPALPSDAADKIASIVRDLYESLAVADRPLAFHLRAAKTFTPPAMRLMSDLLHEMQAAIDQQDVG